MTTSGVGIILKDLATSVEDLADIVARGFSDVSRRIDGVEEGLTTRIDAFEERTDARFMNVEQKIDALTVDVRTLAYDHGRLKTRVEHLEESEFVSVQEP